MSDGFENSKHCFGFSDRLVKKANHEQFMSRILLKNALLYFIIEAV